MNKEDLPRRKKKKSASVNRKKHKTPREQKKEWEDLESAFTQPSYLSSVYDESDESDTSNYSDYYNKIETHRRDVPWLIVALSMLMFCGSFDLAFSERISSLGFMFFNDHFIHFLLVNIMIWPVVIFKICVTKSIGRNMLRFPKYKFVLLSLVDTCGFFLQIIPLYFLPYGAAYIFSSTLVVINFVNCFIFTNYRYSLYNYLGLIILSLGTVMYVWPKFEFSTYVLAVEWWGWVLVICALILSFYLRSVAIIMREQYLKLKDYNLDIYYMAAMTSLFNFIFRIFAFFIIFIPVEDFPFVPISGFPQYFVDGLKCWIGGLKKECSFCWVISLLSVFCWLATHLLLLFVYKRSTSTLGILTRIICFPIANLVLLWNIIGGLFDFRRFFDVYDVFTILIMFFAIVSYFLGSIIIGDKIARRDDKLLYFKRVICPLFTKKGTKTSRRDETKKFFEEIQRSSTKEEKKNPFFSAISSFFKKFKKSENKGE